MKFCEQCGARLKADALFCEKCGEPTLRCKRCGAGLKPGMNFCENCGTKVPEPGSEPDLVPPARQQNTGKPVSDHPSRQETSSPDSGDKWSFGSLFSIFSSQKTFTLFQDRNWKSLWENAAKKARNHELCIIMTHEPKLIEQLGCTQEELRTVLKDYVDALEDHGVSYYYLDLAKNAVLGEVDSTDVEMIVDLLKTISQTARPKYLFILGDNSIVNVKLWDDETDYGEYVKSDLPFCTMNTDSPWDNKKYDYDKMIRTGRLPTLKDKFQSFKAYFTNAAKGIGHAGTPYASGIGAEVWKKEAVYEFKHISGNKLEISPETTLDNYLERIDREKTNIYFFNLHGGWGKDEMCWAGQPYPGWPLPCIDCVQPSFFEGVKVPYFIGVEACYGGRYVDQYGANGPEAGLGVPYTYPEEESILRTVMANNCLSMLASSETAYGTSAPEGGWADLIVGEFLAEIKEGKTAGDAYIAGVKRLMKSKLDDTVFKTLAEFSLYGDPTACMGPNPNLTSAKSISLDIPKGIHVPIPDVLGPIRLLEAKVDRKIEQAIDRFIMDDYLSRSSSKEKSVPVSVKTYRIDSINLTERIYTFKSSKARNIVKVYFDEKGNIQRTCSSK